MKKIWIVLCCLPTLLVAQEKKAITLDDIYRKGVFRSEGVPGFSSMSDGRYYTEFTPKGMVRKAFATGETVDTLIKSTDVKDDKGKALDFYDMEWSGDEKKILIFKDRESIYRRSSKAIVYVFDLATKKTVLIDTSKILHATFSPDGSKVAYVKNNNLYYKNLATNKVVTITKDGKWNEIINGNCDWVYEEEFEFTKAFAWSEKGNYIAYYRFDERKVPQFSMTMFEGLYPNTLTWKYPKAGDPNSIIEIHTYNIVTGKDVKADIGTNTDIYIPRIKWTKQDNQLAIAWLNRLQNHLQWKLADANTGKTSLLYEEKDTRYVEINDDTYFFNDGKRYLISSEKDGYRDLYIGTLGSSTLQRVINAPYDIASLLGVDEKNGFIYFTSVMRGPSGKDFCRYNMATQKIELIDERIGTHNISFNADYTYYVNNYSNFKTPPVIQIFKTDDIGSSNRTVRLLKDNARLANTLKNYQMGQAEFLTINNSNGDALSAWMLKPYNFDASKKYPVLFCNYGGPGSQQVANRWGSINMWQQMLSGLGYIIVCVDNTGTGYKGADFKKKTYGQLGNLEIADQIDAAKYMATLPFVDSKRIGHWGWSFGGFMSSLAITKGADVFSTAIAVAPVTSWRYYDNIYTERFMGLPATNGKNYDETAPLKHVSKIKGKYLIIHGTADDNVHFQNAVMMVDEMVKKNIEFESAYYPNKNHGINGGNTTFHLYTKMTKFILNNL
jgi:dipeptidyl-peptidase-4